MGHSKQIFLAHLFTWVNSISGQLYFFCPMLQGKLDFNRILIWSFHLVSLELNFYIWAAIGDMKHV